MTDFIQHGQISTLHDLGTTNRERLESLLLRATRRCKLGLILPVTASDMRAPFARIVDQLQGACFIEHIVVVLNVAPSVDDYCEARTRLAPLGEKAQILWTDGARVEELFRALNGASLDVNVPHSKGRSVWTAFGYLLADPRLQAYVLHDCDIVNYDRDMLARLCLPMAHPSFDFEFCKAYYARRTDRMHGRVVRLLVSPLLRALMLIVGNDRFLAYLDSFRYPLSGEFAITANLASSNRIPSDWGLEIGTLAEVFRNTSIKRVCQVDICSQYEHKHQPLSLDDPTKGLMRMATDILTTILRTLASMGVPFQPGHFVTLRSAYLRTAQDAIRQYHADALINGLEFDRHEEEQAVEGFAGQIITAGEAFQRDPAGGDAISNWSRILAAFPDFPNRLRQAAQDDAREFRRKDLTL